MTKRPSEDTTETCVSKRLKCGELPGVDRSAVINTPSTTVVLPSSSPEAHMTSDIMSNTQDLMNTGRQPSQTALNITEAHRVDANNATFYHAGGNLTNIFTKNITNNVTDHHRPTEIHPISEDKRKEIFNWLSPVIPSANFYGALEIRANGTGMWFLQSKVFEEWVNTADLVVWIHGKSGCGKTVLSSSIIENISHRCDNNIMKAHAYGYFFFDGRDSQKGLQNYENLVRSLIWQFSDQSDSLPQALLDLYDECGTGTRQPSVTSLRNTLLLVLNGFKHAYLILDALDECTERNQLLAWINDITGWKAGKLHLLATSRQDRDIENTFLSLCTQSICLEGRSVDLDIETYLDQMLADCKTKREWNQNPEIYDHIKVSLLRGAQGMFRWVALQLDQLRTCLNQDEVKKQLVSLPRDLNESYDRCIRRIDKAHYHDARRLLQWLAFSIRPLELAELAEVVTVDFESQDLPCFRHERRYFDPRAILTVCPGFVAITGGKVKLAHLSVKEYLLFTPNSSLCITETISHSDISKTCLAYLAQFDCEDSFHSSTHSQENPLAFYAAQHWISHAESGGVDDLRDRLVNNIFQNPCVFDNWIRLHDIDDADIRIGYELPEAIPNPLYYASLAGLTRVVEMLLHKGADVNAQGGTWGNALQAASSHGHHEIVRMLLSSGVNVNARGGRHDNALYAASSRGDEEIVAMLLDNGADVNAFTREDKTALMVASFNGRAAIVELLLNHGADVNVKGGWHGNALHAASSRGHEEIVTMLLHSGVNVNAFQGEDGTALVVASFNNHTAIIKTLLHHRADVNVEGGRYGNALYAASSRGHEEAVKILLDNGANVNTFGGYSGTALMVASLNNHTTTIKTLLHHGADVNVKGRRYGNALYTASSRGHEEMIAMLLDNGANVNAFGGYYGTALMVASLNGHAATITTLLNHGADVNAKGGWCGNALYAASQENHEEIVTMLLDNGANVNAFGGHHGTALVVASWNGHTSTIKTLLDHGADVDAKGGRYGNALYAASFQDHKEIVKILLDNGANVNAFGGYYGTALMVASLNGHAATIKTLLNHGANVNAKGGWCGNALYAASFRGHKEIVRMLLNNGADVNAFGGDHGTALAAALCRNHTAIVHALLEHGADAHVHGRRESNALYIASEEGHDEFVKMLLDNSADVREHGTAMTTSR